MSSLGATVACSQAPIRAGRDMRPCEDDRSSEPHQTWVLATAAGRMWRS
jgi:hypothetical protein